MVGGASFNGEVFDALLGFIRDKNTRPRWVFYGLLVVFLGVCER